MLISTDSDALPLNYRNRNDSGHLFGDACPVNDINDAIDILVGGRRFFGQARQAAGPDMNA